MNTVEHRFSSVSVVEVGTVPAHTHTTHTPTRSPSHVPLPLAFKIHQIRYGRRSQTQSSTYDLDSLFQSDGLPMSVQETSTTVPTQGSLPDSNKLGRKGPISP